MNRKKSLILVILVSVISNCGPVINVTQLSTTPFPPKPKDAPISVLMTKAPRCPYVEVAIISASEGSFAGGMETFVDAMKVRARALGADGLLLGDIGTRTEGYIAVSPGIIVAAEGKTMTAVVIRFLNRDCID